MSNGAGVSTSVAASQLNVTRPWMVAFALAGVALLGAALIRTPWITLLVVATLYLLMLPFAFASYQRVKRRRAAAAAHATAVEASQRA